MWCVHTQLSLVEINVDTTTQPFLNFDINATFLSKIII